MEFDRLIHWIQLPLEEVKLPDLFLNITTTTGGTSETSAITETTRFICPTMPVSIPAEEPQTTPPSVLTMSPAPGPMPAFPPQPPPPPPPPQPPQPSTQLPFETEGSQTPTTQTEMELEMETAPQTLQRRYTWPRYPKPSEPPKPTYPQVDFSLPPLTTRAPADSQLPWYRPTRPGPPDHFETFTWPFASTGWSFISLIN
ncbi:platelet glycoprotein Ib alpha chain-like [Schistocerca americana]|uniref:platelet glycoprotein Ib alpha chain-like n=1 Tax=Schistocerca americana TaxID=7009 RepID=UPI001F50343F|nr:platelet glycoprotein Ib alpha chain-like [Schistocerca americana]